MPEKNLKMKSLRAGKLWTQLMLSEKVGCSERLVTLIECGRSSPSWGLACRLAEVLGTTVEDLFPEMASVR
jgi:DNA-binding XRE family transcriptional regulator